MIKQDVILKNGMNHSRQEREREREREREMVGLLYILVVMWLSVSLHPLHHGVVDWSMICDHGISRPFHFFLFCDTVHSIQCSVLM